MPVQVRQHIAALDPKYREQAARQYQRLNARNRPPDTFGPNTLGPSLPDARLRRPDTFGPSEDKPLTTAPTPARLDARRRRPDTF